MTSIKVSVKASKYKHVLKLFAQAYSLYRSNTWYYTGGCPRTVYPTTPLLLLPRSSFTGRGLLSCAHMSEEIYAKMKSSILLACPSCTAHRCLKPVLIPFRIHGPPQHQSLIVNTPTEHILGILPSKNTCTPVSSLQSLNSLVAFTRRAVVTAGDLSTIDVSISAAIVIRTLSRLASKDVVSSFWTT